MRTAEATSIVLLPGMDGTGELLRDLADRLARHRPVQVLAYPLDEPLGYSQLAAYVVERAPNRPFVILGESFSGPIAIEIAATDPRVTGLILASSFARHPLPAWLAPLTPLLDPSWLPRRFVAAALRDRHQRQNLQPAFRRCWRACLARSSSFGPTKRCAWTSAIG